MGLKIFIRSGSNEMQTFFYVDSYGVKTLTLKSYDKFSLHMDRTKKKVSTPFGMELRKVFRLIWTLPIKVSTTSYL